MRPSSPEVTRTPQRDRRPARGALASRRCPHCNGTGEVIVGSRGHRWPCFRDPDRPDWKEVETRDCGVCGGDGFIDRWDEVEPLYDEWCHTKLK